MENLKKVFDVVVEAGNVADKIVQSVKAGAAWASLSHLMLLMDEIMALPGVDFSVVHLEWKASREESHAQLKAHVKAKFDLADDKVEELVELALAMLADVDSFAGKAVQLVALKKAA